MSGRAALSPRSDFPVLEEVVYLNTGSYGLEPLPVRHAAEVLGGQIAGRVPHLSLIHI